MNRTPIPNPDFEMSVPIHTSVIFSMNTPSSDDGLQYGRIGNRTRQHLEQMLCELHHADHGYVTATGSAAILVAFMLLSQGSSILCHEELYEGTRRILSLLKPFGVDCIVVNMHDHKQTLHCTEKSKPSLLWIETPTNPSLRVLDIEKLSELAHRNNALVAVDTTMCSSILQTPLDQGADIVVESLTKHINGHSDAMGGFIGTNSRELAARMRTFIQTTGPTMSPFDAALIERGVKTAEVRIKTQQQSAIAVAKFLSHHKKISRIFFPGSENPDERRSMKKQMRGRGSIVSFEVDSSVNPITLVERLKTIKICHSFGGTESIVQIPSIMMDFTGVPKNSIPSDRLIRLSVGLEPRQAIQKDLEQALEQSSGL